MHLRALSTALFVLCLGSLSVACDKQEDAKTDAKAKVDEKKTDAKGDEKKADTADAKAEGGNAEGKSDEKAEGANAEGKSDEKADEGGAEGKADEAKADEAKADPDEKKAAPDEKKAAPDEKKADEKKEDTKKAPKDPKPDEGKTDPAPSGIDGKDIFGKKCKSCHGATGDGKTKIGEENDIEDWTAAGWKGKWPESKIIDIVTNGKAGTKMKPFKDKLTADEIKAVSKYARTLGK